MFDYNKSLLNNFIDATRIGALHKVLVTHEGGKTIFEDGVISAYIRTEHTPLITLSNYGFTHEGIYYKSTTPQSGAETTITSPNITELLDMGLISKTTHHNVSFNDDDVSHVYSRYFKSQYQYTLEYFKKYNEIYVIERDEEFVRTQKSTFRFCNNSHETDDTDYFVLGTPDFVNKQDHIFQISLVCDINFEAYSRVLPLMNVFANTVNMPNYPTEPSELVLRKCK